MKVSVLHDEIDVMRSVHCELNVWVHAFMFRALIVLCDVSCTSEGDMLSIFTLAVL